MSEFILIDDYFIDRVDLDAEIPLWLFHGTTDEDSERIAVSGPKLDAGRENLDFDRGFYTTRDPRHAYNWAGPQGKCIPFFVFTEVWVTLKCLVAIGDEWAQLVADCLCNRPTPRPVVDVIEGQICENPKPVKSGEIPKGFGTQTVFKTKAALSCLERVVGGEICHSSQKVE